MGLSASYFHRTAVWVPSLVKPKRDQNTFPPPNTGMSISVTDVTIFRGDHSNTGSGSEYYGRKGTGDATGFFVTKNICNSYMIVVAMWR